MIVYLCILLLLVQLSISLGLVWRGPPLASVRRTRGIASRCTSGDGQVIDNVTSPKIESLTRRIEQLRTELDTVRLEIAKEREVLRQLDEEFGPEIARVRKEFNRMKERSYEEATAVSNKAKVDALKEVLPLMDNYVRAKKVFDPLQTDEERKIGALYDDLFNKFSKILEEFGMSRVDSLGKPFDVNFMEAIMTAPSSEYAKDVVCTEYQAGYRMGDMCVRPAMVVVSLGPGPS